MSAPGTPNAAAVRPAGTPGRNTNPVLVIIPKWNYFLETARKGTLGEDSASMIRTLLANSTRLMIYHGFMMLKINIFENNMPAILDPRASHNGEPPALTQERYNKEKTLAIDDLRAMTQRKGNAATGAGPSASGSGTTTPRPVRPAAVASSSSAAATSQAGSSPAAPSPNASTPQPQATASSSRPATPGAATSSVGTRPPAAATAGAGSATRPPPNRANMVFPPPPDHIMPFEELRQLLTMDQTQKTATLAADPALARRFNESAKWYGAQQKQKQMQQQQQKQSGPASGAATPISTSTPVRPAGSTASIAGQSSGPSTPSRAEPAAPAPASAPGPAQATTTSSSSGPSWAALNPQPTPAAAPARPPVAAQPKPPNQAAQPTKPAPPPAADNAGGPSAPNPSQAQAPSATGTNPLSSMPPRPFNLSLPPSRNPPFQAQPPPPPPPAPIPIESEIDRRKRKVREMLAEEAPGMQIEQGVQRVISEYLDAWFDEAAEGAIRLSKHRKAAKVELKDMALAIDMKHDLRIPGFNVQLPTRPHVPSDAERRRGKAVAPRAAARKVREAE